MPIKKNTKIPIKLFMRIIIKTTLSITVSICIVCLICSNAFAIPISREREIADEFMEAIERQDKLIRDPMALALVSEIGERILKTVPAQPFKYSFYIVDEDQFNAFAGPGSNIFVHRGLITSIDNVDELAGIIGHEIAHSSCRHISDMVDQSKAMTIGMLAGVLAGVLLGAAGGGSGELGQAVLIGSVAGGQTAMLSYSREHETEADQKGLVYLVKAGFDPSGLLTGLQKIRSRDWFGSETVPDYLKTHPGSTERIVQIQSWIEGRGKTDVANQKSRKMDGGKGVVAGKRDFQQSTADPFRFKTVQYRLAAIYGNEDDAEKKFSTILNKEPDDISANYGMALLMERKSRLDESMRLLRKALETRPFDPNILLEIGKVNILARNPQKAVEIMQGLETIPEVETEALFYLSQARLMSGMADVAEKGFQKVSTTSPDLFPKAYYHLAQINGERAKEAGSTTENAALSHYYLGLYYYEIRNMKSARVHLVKSLETLADQEKKKHAHLILVKSEKREQEEKMDAKRRRR